MKNRIWVMLFSAIFLCSCTKGEAVEEQDTVKAEAEVDETITPDLVPSPSQVTEAAEPAPPETAAQPAEATEPSPGSAVPTTAWTVDTDASRLGFSATQNGNSFDGVFERFEAAIDFDVTDLSTASIEVTIDMDSASTGDKQRDSALPGGDWFKVKEFPTARFVSRSLSQTGEGVYEAAGSLTIRGVTKDISLPFTLIIDGDTAKANGTVILIRTDFDVGQGEFSEGKWVGLDVSVTIDLTATR